MNDKEVIERMLAGDDRGMNYLYSKNEKILTKIVIKNSGTETEAKDVIQDCMLVFWKKVMSGDFVLTSKISTYLYSVTWNLWRKQLEKKKKLVNEEIESAIIPDWDVQEQVRIVQESMAQLGESSRRVLQLYCFDGRTMGEIADEMGYANSNVAKTKRYKAALQLRDIIKSQYKSGDLLD